VESITTPEIFPFDTATGGCAKAIVARQKNEIRKANDFILFQKLLFSFQSMRVIPQSCSNGFRFLMVLDGRLGLLDTPALSSTHAVIG
jgi:hypothetical protein